MPGPLTLTVAWLEQEFLTEIAILKVDGKLRKDVFDDFSNVYDHSMAVALTTEVMRRHLNLPRVVTAAGILHDLKKRFEKRPQDFTPEEVGMLEIARQLMPEDLRDCTAPLTREVAERNVTFRSRVLELADMWTLGDKVVGLKARMEGTKARWPHLDWDLHMEWGRKLENEIWDALMQQRVVSGEQRLLDWVLSQIRQ